MNDQNNDVNNGIAILNGGEIENEICLSYSLFEYVFMKVLTVKQFNFLSNKCSSGEPIVVSEAVNDEKSFIEFVRTINAN